MGVVFGKISFRTSTSPFHLILDHCLAQAVTVNHADPKHEFIDTQVMPNLRVFREDGLEIVGQGCYFSGLKEDGYAVTILGVPHPFYGEEFPSQCKAYLDRFKGG